MILSKGKLREEARNLVKERASEAGTALARCTVRGGELGASDAVRSKEIVTAIVDVGDWPGSQDSEGQVDVLTPIGSRVGSSRSRPAAAEMAALGERIAVLEAELLDTNARLGVAVGDDHYRLTHCSSVVERELLELRLSRELNERRAATADEVSIPDDADPVIAQLGWALNELRVKRRIYDYVVVSLGS